MGFQCDPNSAACSDDTAPSWRPTTYQRALERARSSGITVARARAAVAAEAPRRAPAPPPPPRELCGLGARCTIHHPKTVEPFVPGVTEWDLLPDAPRGWK